MKLQDEEKKGLGNQLETAKKVTNHYIIRECNNIYTYYT